MWLYCNDGSVDSGDINVDSNNVSPLTSAVSTLGNHHLMSSSPKILAKFVYRARQYMSPETHKEINQEYEGLKAALKSTGD